MKTKLKPLLSFATDADAERFVAADLSCYELSDFKTIEHSELMVQEAREVIENRKTSPTDQLKSVMQLILAASADGSLQTHIRHIVADNRQKAEHLKNS